MSNTASIDPAKQEAFVSQVLVNTSAAMVTTLAALGDRLGLFKALAKSGPVSSAEFASRAGIVERYAREWLGGMTSAGYISYDAATGRFALPSEHAAALADEGGPVFFGGLYEMLLSASSVVDQVAEAFRSGGGVPQSAYDTHFWNGMERFSGAWYDNFLVQQWLPAMPDVERKLRQGASVADVGCGGGRAPFVWRRRFRRAASSDMTRSRRASSGRPHTRAKPASRIGCGSRCTMPPAICRPAST